MKKIFLPLALALALGACGQVKHEHCCDGCPYAWIGDGHFGSSRGLHNEPIEFNDRVENGHYYNVPGICPHEGKAAKKHVHYHAPAAAADAKKDGAKKDGGKKTR